MNVARTIQRLVWRMPAERAIRRMMGQGVPAGLEPALRYLITETLPVDDRKVLAPIGGLRSQLLAQQHGSPTVFDSPSPIAPGSIPVPGRPKHVTWHYLAEKTSVTHYWGVFLYLCAKHLPAQTILELGGAVGMSASYMAAASPSLRLTTVEGSTSLAPVAAANLRVMNPSAIVLNAMFDDALDSLLPRLSAPLDIVHIDGQHETVSTFHYLDRVRPHLHQNSVVIFDDIHWNADMRHAWNGLCGTSGFSYCIDVGRYGVCVWGGADSHPETYSFSRYTSDWRNEDHNLGT